MDRQNMVEILNGQDESVICEKTGLHFNTIKNFKRGKGCNMATFEKLQQFCEGVRGVNLT
jgi:hypothetical protein